MFRRPISVLIVSVPIATTLAACLDDTEPDHVARADEVAEPHAPEERARIADYEADDFAVPAAFDGKYDPILDANGAPVEPSSDTEEYAGHGVNPFVDVRTDPLSTFSVDVDTGSYTIARRKLNEGSLPPADAVRVEEFVNYFRYDYAEPESGPFAVHLEGAPSPFVADATTHLVRVGVQGVRVDSSSRKPVHLTFLVDVSGSMRGCDRLRLAQKSLRVLTNNLGPEDTVAIATYSGRVGEVLGPTGMNERGKILEAIDSLHAAGSTAMGDGLQLAYRLASQNIDASHVNRVVVLSDGDANVGSSSHAEMLKSIRGYVEKGVTLSTIGFGMGNYKDTMMEQLANKGNGNYYYVDSEEEARKIFGEQLDGTLQVIAKDVKIQVEFNPEAVKRYRLIGYENRAIADEEFRDDTVDAGEIGAGHTVTAMYEIELRERTPSKLAEVRVRHKAPRGDRAREQVFRLNALDLHERVSDSSRDFQFAAAVTAFAEILRKSPYAAELDYDLVHEVASGATNSDQSDRREFLQLVERARAL